MRLFDIRSAYNRAVLQHVFEIDEVAVMHVLSKIIGVVEVNDTCFVRGDDVFRQQNTLGYVLADFARHIVSLNAVDGRVFVGIFLFDFLVVALDKA